MVINNMVRTFLHKSRTTRGASSTKTFLNAYCPRGPVQTKQQHAGNGESTLRGNKLPLLQLSLEFMNPSIMLQMTNISRVINR